MKPVHVLLTSLALLPSGCAAWQHAPQSVFRPITPAPQAGEGWTTSSPLSAPGPTTTNRPVSPAPQPTTLQPKSTPAFRPDLEDESLRGPAISPDALHAPGASQELLERLEPDAAEEPTEPTGVVRPLRMPGPQAELAGNTRAASTDANSLASGTVAGAAASTMSGVNWQPVGQSAGGRPIEAAQFGKGPRHLLVFASLYGNEAASVQCVEQLAARWSADPQVLQEWNVFIVRSPNPDGFAEGTITNSRGVVLNRNFPSSNVLARPTTETGPSPASESETQLLLQILDDFRPDRVVHVRRASVIAGWCSPTARPPSRSHRMNRGLFDGGAYEAFKVGSIEELVTVDERIELLDLRLPPRVTGLASAVASRVETDRRWCVCRSSGRGRPGRPTTRVDPGDHRVRPGRHRRRPTRFTSAPQQPSAAARATAARPTTCSHRTTRRPIGDCFHAVVEPVKHREGPDGAQGVRATTSPTAGIRQPRER
ncbi:MAG: M14 family zinc carboxypeptidase [Planctomycetaceae bacterium]